MADYAVVITTRMTGKETKNKTGRGHGEERQSARVGSVRGVERVLAS